MKPGKENEITLAVTSEFLFYTNEPLTLQDFESLLNSVYSLVEKQPENLHLIFSSFAVRTPDNKIMNVAVHSQCGKKPQMHLIVKNNPSHIDPVYTKVNENGMRQYFPYVDIEKGDSLDKYAIKVKGSRIEFSFANVFECTTSKDGRFFLCVEICFDHFQGVAKKKLLTILTEKLNKNNINDPYLPTQCLHVITSNGSNIIADNSLGKLNNSVSVTQADPEYSEIEAKNLTEKQKEGLMPLFGSKLKVNLLDVKPCPILPEWAMILVNNYNSTHKNMFISQASRKKRPT